MDGKVIAIFGSNLRLHENEIKRRKEKMLKEAKYITSLIVYNSTEPFYPSCGFQGTTTTESSMKSYLYAMNIFC